MAMASPVSALVGWCEVGGTPADSDPGLLNDFYRKGRNQSFAPRTGRSRIVMLHSE